MLDSGAVLMRVKDTVSPESGSLATIGEPTVELAAVFSFTPKVTLANTCIAHRGKGNQIQRK